jgi:hypothetical protein
MIVYLYFEDKKILKIVKKCSFFLHFSVFFHEKRTPYLKTHKQKLY